jgi:hypothetical protein
VLFSWKILQFQEETEVRYSQVWAVQYIVQNSESRQWISAVICVLAWDFTLSRQRKSCYMSAWTFWKLAFNICTILMQCSELINGVARRHEFWMHCTNNTTGSSQHVFGTRRCSSELLLYCWTFVMVLHLPRFQMMHLALSLATVFHENLLPVHLYHNNDCWQVSIHFCFSSSLSTYRTYHVHNYWYSGSAITSCNHSHEMAISLATATEKHW